MPSVSGCMEYKGCPQIQREPAKQERIFPPQTGPGIFGSAADSVSLGEMFFVPNII